MKDTAPGDVIYAVSVFVGLNLWGFSIPWFIGAVMMVAAAGGFPFNMGWWGFIFPVGLYSLFSPCLCGFRYRIVLMSTGVFTLLTISLGEELESKFFKVLSCVSSRETYSFRICRG